MTIHKRLYPILWTEAAYQMNVIGKMYHTNIRTPLTKFTAGLHFSSRETNIVTAPILPQCTTVQDKLTIIELYIRVALFKGIPTSLPYSQYPFALSYHDPHEPCLNPNILFFQNRF
jgi:hypothetical protein